MDIHNRYQQAFKFYIDNIYNQRLLGIINKIVLETKIDISKIRLNYPLHKLILNTVKTYMMTENELVYFSIYLDRFGWASSEFFIEDYFGLIALTVKMYLNDDISIIAEYIKQTNPKLEENHRAFIESKNSIGSLLNVTPREVNLKFHHLTRPINIYCKSNYIDNNFLVDQILAMSLPYSEVKRESSKKDENLSVLSYNPKSESSKSENKIPNLLIENNPFINKIKKPVNPSKESKKL